MALTVVGKEACTPHVLRNNHGRPATHLAWVVCKTRRALRLMGHNAQQRQANKVPLHCWQPT